MDCKQVTDTYNWRIKSCGIVDGDYGCVNIVEVDLALGLELVHEIQEAKCKCGAWLSQRCRKPSHTQELNARRLLCPWLPTITIADANGRDAGNVEDAEVDRNGRCYASFTDTMAKLIYGTKIKDCGPGEKLACPFLGDTSIYRE